MQYYFILLSVLSFVSYVHAEPSQCYGTTSRGSIKNAVKLPAKGSNFVGYSVLAQSLGRTYVHSVVKDIVISAYASVKEIDEKKVYKYAETGFKQGGTFKPHKTHQNGLSVDFITPVLNNDGESVHLPTHALNKFGYNIEFDNQGRYENYVIDYEALALHIVYLHRHAKAMGFDVWRVIFDPELQSGLFDTDYGEYLKQHINFSTKRSWVRHDEHYHVDFAIPCEP